MKRIAGVFALMAWTLPACSLSLGTVGSWSSATPPPMSLGFASSVVMPDGEVVFVGGFDSTGQPLTRVLRFDPKGNRWSQAAPLPVQESGYSIAALSDGSVLVAGGGGGGIASEINLLATSWLYDPRLDSWKRVGDLHVARSGGATVLLTDGRVLIAGGTVLVATPNFFGFGVSAETFDPRTDSWSLVGSMKVARDRVALLALPQGRALAVGGCASVTYGSLGDPVASAEVFDSITGTWTATTPLPARRCGSSLVTLRDGRPLLIGGFSPGLQEGPFTDAFFYDEDKRTWTPAGSTVAGASSPILLADGQVFVAAAQAGPVQGGLASFVVGGQVFDPASGHWNFATSTTVSVPFRLTLAESVAPTVIAQSDNKVFVRLGEAGLFTFNSLGSPPSALILDSSGLTLVLAGFAGALCLWLVIAYARARGSHD
jgi:hypothetical protein